MKRVNPKRSQSGFLILKTNGKTNKKRINKKPGMPKQAIQNPAVEVAARSRFSKRIDSYCLIVPFGPKPKMGDFKKTSKKTEKELILTVKLELLCPERNFSNMAGKRLVTAGSNGPKTK